jgi:calcineurin-like phosphoesterase family protein
MLYFTSDQHFSHARIIEYCNRGFSDIHSMNKTIVERHNSVVKPDDVVYHLGDFALNEKVVGKILPKLNGTHHLISGNHDKCHSKRGNHQQALIRYFSYGFKSIQEQMEMGIGKYEVLLNHLPYANTDDPDQRFQSYRPIDKGQILLHGHCHTRWLIKGRMLNVGVDVHNFTPISEERIVELIEGRIFG